MLRRPKTFEDVCRDCFFRAFEDEVHATITSSSMFKPGERIAVAASGGKDSTVLAHVGNNSEALDEASHDLFCLVR